MVTSAGWHMAKGPSHLSLKRRRHRIPCPAATVSIRYATVRRQGSPDPTNPKLQHQIIQYPSVYSRLLPVLSHAYVFIHLGQTLVRIRPSTHVDPKAKLNGGNSSNLSGK